jgi:hypothetical protein
MKKRKKKKAAAPARRKAARGGARGLVIKVIVPAHVPLQGPELGALSPQQRLDLASMGAKRTTAAPSWVDDPALWRKALRQLGARWKRYEHPYAAAAYVYMRMGGMVSSGGCSASREPREHAPRARGGAPRETRTHRMRDQQGVSVERIDLDELGYDEHGKYYGVGEPVFRVSSEHPYIDEVVRARSPASARARVLERHQH